MSKVAIYADDSGNYTAATALGFVFQSVDRETAADALLATFDVSPDEVDSLLDNPMSADDFRPALMQAVGGTLRALANNQEQVALLTTISIQLATILERQEQQELRQELEKMRTQLLRELDKAKTAAARKGISDATDEEILSIWAANDHALVKQVTELLEATR